MELLLDTHAVLWASEGDSRLGAAATGELSRCPAGGAAISDITLLEIAMLAAKRRIRIAGSLSRYLNGIQTYYPVLPINAEIAAAAFFLKMEQADPFDRVIVATAREHSLPLVTRDSAIQESGLVATVWE